MKLFHFSLLWSYALAANLVLLDDPDARCLDGTPAGYYISGSFENATHFTLSLQGGGECVDYESCISRFNTTMGSSSVFPTTLTLGGIQSSNPAHNPYFSGDEWAHVFLAYCSGDLWCGQRAIPSDITFDMYMTGHLIVDATIDHLLATTNIGNAEQIIWTGESAGGIGAAMQVDYVASKFPQATVRGAPIAGFYFEAVPYTGPGHTSSSLANFSADSFPSYYAMWDAYVDDSCRVAMADEPWRCMLANNSHPFKETPMFFSEAQTDHVVLADHDWVPDNFTDIPQATEYVESWSAEMQYALSLLDSMHGYFNPACYIHTAFSHGHPLINTFAYDDALHSWLSQDGKVPSRLSDDCGIVCNPTCPTSHPMDGY